MPKADNIKFKVFKDLRGGANFDKYFAWCVLAPLLFVYLCAVFCGGAAAICVLVKRVCAPKGKALTAEAVEKLDDQIALPIPLQVCHVLNEKRSEDKKLDETTLTYIHTIINQRLNFGTGDTFQQNAAVEVYIRDKSKAAEERGGELTADTELNNSKNDSR